MRYIDNLARFHTRVWFSATCYVRGSDGILLDSRRVKKGDNEILQQISDEIYCW